MKGLSFLMVSIWLLGTAGLASAQTTNAQGQFIEGAQMSKAQIWGRVHDQIARVNAASKVGKLLIGEAASLLAQLQSIRDTIKADYVENGKKELSDDQKIALNDMLDGTARSISDKGGYQYASP
jgi:cytochrome c553